MDRGGSESLLRDSLLALPWWASLIAVLVLACGVLLGMGLRQKLKDNFLTSPYLRRCFAEDAAIAAHFFYQEAFDSAWAPIIGGAL